MRIESSVTSISWIPSEAVEGLPKLPFTMGVVHYDDPPPDRIDYLELMHRADLFREANELKAWIEVEDGKIVDYGQTGRGRIGLTRLKLGPKEIAVPAVAMPTLQNSEVGPDWVRFTQTAGGRTGMPAPRGVRGKPYFQINSAIAWTTLALTIYADGTSKHHLAGASFGLCPAPLQQSTFLLAPDERRQAGTDGHLKTALHLTRRKHLVDLHGGGDPPEGMRTEAAQGKEALHQPSAGRTDHHRLGLG